MKRSLPSGEEFREVTLPGEECIDDPQLKVGEFIAGLPEVIERWGADGGLRTGDATEEQQLERTAAWHEKLKELRAQPERGEVRIPGVPRRKVVKAGGPRRKGASFREVAGDEKTDELIRVDQEARKAAYRRRMANPAYRRMIYHITHRIG